MKRTFDDTSNSSSLDPPDAKKGRVSTSPATPSVSSAFADAARMSRLPTISRKVRACAACKKQKIRCDFEDGETTCTRCKKMKLECVVNRSLQTILDEDVEWKHKMREDTNVLQRAVDDILHSMQMRPLGSYTTTSGSPAMSAVSSEAPGSRLPPLANGMNMRFQEASMLQARQQQQHHHHQQQQHNMGIKAEEDDSVSRGGPLAAMTRENSQEPHENEGNSLVSNPMGSLYEVTKLRSLRNNFDARQGQASDMDSDFVSRGLISFSEGQELFELFRDSLNHYLFDIALTHDNLNAVRSSSGLLSAAIFTVSSLHLPQHHHLFPRCYREFLKLVSSSMFDRTHHLDDVRALCIGAFWLTDLSWKLSGHAVRIATELNIHQSFRKALAGSTEHFERARLWYLLYVCDHHFSIAYGRPPVIHDHEPMKKYDLYLQSNLAIEGDNRVISQVSLFVIMTRIYDFFEADATEKEIGDESLAQLNVFNEQLDQWRTTWRNRLRHNEFIGDYPANGVDLHYHFAKLQLNSLSLRGASPSTINNISSHRKSFANIALYSATSVLSIVLEEPGIRDSLIGVPLYIHTMIAFAAMFLLKVTARWKSIGFNIEPTQVWGTVERVIELLRQKRASEQHIIFHIAGGLEKMLRKCIEFSNSTSPLDDSRLWDQLLRVESSNAAAGANVLQTLSHETSRGAVSREQSMPYNVAVSAVSSASVSSGHVGWHSYHNSPEANHIGSAAGGSDAGGQVLYPGMSPTAAGAGTGPPPPPPHAMYELNGQYFPVSVPMAAYDFLSPQLPY